MVWEFPEMALFVAAGNSGGLGGNAGCGPGADVGSAGNAKNVFSIGSNNRGTAGNNMSGFSSRGPTQDRRSKPDLTAQGASIVSASRTACGTTSMSGTSMATPTAAGLAALVRDYLARGYYPGGTANAGNAISNPSAALIKAIMITGARSITGTGTTGGAPSQSQGWGRIHLDDALYFAGDSNNLWLHDGTAGLQTGGTDSHTLAVSAGQPLVVTLTWHDAPALVNANPHTVNLLRLEVQAPNGDVWTQKLPATGGSATPTRCRTPPPATTTTSTTSTRSASPAPRPAPGRSASAASRSPRGRSPMRWPPPAPSVASPTRTSSCRRRRAVSPCAPGTTPMSRSAYLAWKGSTTRSPCRSPACPARPPAASRPTP